MNCDPVLGCPVVTCEIEIHDDASPDFPLGVSWEAGKSPVPSHDVDLIDMIVGVVLPTLVPNPPPGYEPPSPYATVPAGLHSETGRWIKCQTSQLNCPGSAATCPLDQAFPVNTYDYFPEGPQLDVESLLDEAMTKLVIGDPPVTSAPPIDANMFVKLPAWFWVDQAYWDQIRVAEQPSESGRLVVRVTGEPQYTQIDPGDGTDPFTCTGAGKEFRMTLDPWTGSDCIHIYLHTPGFTGLDAFDVEMTVAFVLRWEMDFSTQPARDQGTMGTVYRSTSQPIGVTEIQALVLE